MMRDCAIFLAILLIVAFLAPEGHCQRDRRRGGPAVRGITVLGTEHFSEEDVRKVMRTKKSGYFTTKRLRMTTLESDILSIVAFYRRNGFLRAQAEVEEIRYDEPKNNVWITINVREGEQTTVRGVGFEGHAVMNLQTLKKTVITEAGDPLNEDRIAQDEYNIYSLYADAGYIYASISTRLAFGEGKVDLTYLIDEGEPAYIGKIRVSGNRRVGEPIIRREVDAKPGDLFSRKTVLESQQDLYDTGLFKDVGIDPSPAGADSGLVDLVVKVKERKMKEVNAGLGYGTLDEARVSLGWRHRNLFKAALLFNVNLVLGTKDFDKGLTRKRIDASLTDRWLLGTRLTGGLRGYAQETLERYNSGSIVDGEYTLDRVGIDFGITKDFTRTFRLSLGSYCRMTSATTGIPQTTISSRVTMVAWPGASLGKSNSDVASPLPRSSSMAIWTNFCISVTFSFFIFSSPLGGCRSDRRRGTPVSQPDFFFCRFCFLEARKWLFFLWESARTSSGRSLSSRS